MRKFGGQILFSATDLMRFMGCRHATALDLAHMNGTGPKPREDSDDAELLQKQGDAHEAAHLEEEKATGKNVVEIERGDLLTNAEETRKALATGAEVIFQGALLSGRWGGWSDFLERVEKPSSLGSFSYEVADTKLKRSPHPKHVLQLVLYSDLLTEIQGVAPEFAHVQLGDGRRASIRLDDYVHYARAARDRLEAFVAKPLPTRPEPCADCGLCRWGDHCADIWRDEDALFNVANISKVQVKKLKAAGIKTLAELAAHDGNVRGMAGPTLERLKTQARLQQSRKTSPPAFELRPALTGKGFDLLPQPQKGDLFYDIEGDPYFESGLEYLHGIWFDGQFKAFWAHDHQAEGEALKQLFDFFRARLKAFPQARIYHYAPYEITALRRLTAKYGIGEAFLDRLLRERRFVDLYAVVRGGVIASEPNYSIKSLEVFYGLERKGEVKTAGGSVVAYEAWRETRDQHILDEIESYNKVDCISTELLRDWLAEVRPNVPWPKFGVDAGEKESTEDAEALALRSRLEKSNLPIERQEMLFNLGMFHKREAKPAWWAIFDSHGREVEELVDDLDALGGLEAIGAAVPIKRSMARTYRFPAQETKFRTGAKASVPAAGGGVASLQIEHLDRSQNTVTVKIGSARADLLTDGLSLHPDTPLETTGIAQALRDVIEDQCGERKYRAAEDLLGQCPPRLKGRSGEVMQGVDLVAGTIEAIADMDHTVLPIQGPPGTGKTYVTANAILALVASGKRVGVASNSHEAVRNVLMGCLNLNMERTSPLKMEVVHKLSGDSDGYPENCPVIRTTDNARAAEGKDIVGGTAFFYAREENIQAFDYLFVDEAGQVGLANMAAMARAARNIVLVGDPCQLPQVIQGSHPYPANLSCLEWMLDGHATIPPDRGIFLPVTRRMHPEVCRFISEQVYEGRLESHPDTAGQAVSETPYPHAGTFWVPVVHEGNAQVATEEVAAIVAACNALTRGKWTDKDGNTREVRGSDIIVVAPYNAQVNALRDALPDGIRVGTVDKFQGQEAPICLVSMTASSAEETPRGMEFLFSLNRINVAVSRAKGLALVFGSARLRETKCANLEQMRLVNTLCALTAFETS